MDSRYREYFTKALMEQLNNLVDSGGQTISAIMEQENSCCSDFVEEASIFESRVMLLRLRTRESRLIKKIEAALGRIKDGTFGICEICEEEISIRRIKARPVTTQCIKCKTQSEIKER